MSGKIIKLEPENYVKCSNIWNMERNPRQTQRWYEELLSGNCVIFVYAVDGEYLGEAALVFDNGDSDYTIENRRVYLSRMIVKPECRNNGIGGLLIDYLMDYAKNLGYAEMSLGVDIVNVGARWLYEKRGFTSTIFVGEDKYGRYVKLLKTL